MNRTDALWWLAVLTFGAGDMLTTMVGLETGLVEQAPLYEGMHASLPAVAFAAKLVVFTGALAAYEYVPKPVNVGIPVGLALLGTAVTAWNGYLILLVA